MTPTPPKTIEPKRLNIRVMEQQRFFCLDSHSAALAMAYRHPHKKQHYLKQAANYRRQYEELGYQLKVAKHYRSQQTH